MPDNEVHISTDSTMDKVFCGRNNPGLTTTPGGLWAVKEAKLAICPDCLRKLKDTPTPKQSDGITASNTRIGGASEEPPKSEDFANSQDVNRNAVNRQDGE